MKETLHANVIVLYNHGKRNIGENEHRMGEALEHNEIGEMDDSFLFKKLEIRKAPRILVQVHFIYLNEKKHYLALQCIKNFDD